MMIRVVFDCMLYVQAIARGNGPAARCLNEAEAGRFELLVSDPILAEALDVITRPGLRKTFIRATDQDIAEFFSRLSRTTMNIDSVPSVVRLTRDPKDAMYLDLAIAANAAFVVSRDNDLLDLMTGTDAEAIAFRTAYPGIRILDPVAFLATLPHTP